MEASTLTHASRAGLLGRRSPLLKLASDEKLVAMIRSGHEHAFEALFDRYHSRLLAFCRHMLRSTEDAEDVLQEVFVKAHAAMLADERPINARPWLYRIARNRSLNHLRRPVPEGQDSMDIMVGEGGVTTADRVQGREDFRSLVADVKDLPETQRTALLLREIDALSYEEIAQTMDTTVPAVKSLLVRARMSLAEASQSRQLTCGEVRLELAEAAEGLCKASGPVRQHVKRCEPCHEFRGQLRSNTKSLAALAPLGPLALLHKLIVAKLGGSGSAAGGTAAGTGGVAGGSAVAGTGAGAAAAGAGGAAAGAGGAAAAASGGGAAIAGGAAAAGAGGIGGALGAKAAATAATAALLTAGAVEVRQIYSDKPVDDGRDRAAAVSGPPARGSGGIGVVGAGEITLQTHPATATASVSDTATPVDGPSESAAPPAERGSRAAGRGAERARRAAGAPDHRSASRRRRRPHRRWRGRGGRRRQRQRLRRGHGRDRRAGPGASGRRAHCTAGAASERPAGRGRAGPGRGLLDRRRHRRPSPSRCPSRPRPSDRSPALRPRRLERQPSAPDRPPRGALEGERPARGLHPLGDRGEADVPLGERRLATARLHPVPVVGHLQLERVARARQLDRHPARVGVAGGVGEQLAGDREQHLVVEVERRAVDLDLGLEAALAAGLARDRAERLLEPALLERHRMKRFDGLAQALDRRLDHLVRALHLRAPRRRLDQLLVGREQRLQRIVVDQLRDPPPPLVLGLHHLGDELAVDAELGAQLGQLIAQALVLGP